MDKLSWDNLNNDHDMEDYHDQYDSLCANSKPSDFYFAVMQEPNYNNLTTVAMAPKAYFNAEGYMWDQHMMIERILPEDFGEDMESVWSSERSAEEVRRDLLSRGFEESVNFTALVNESFD